MKKIGIYAGTFNPFHVGHLDIAQQAQRLFDEVHIVRATNPNKTTYKVDMPKSRLEARGFMVYEHDGLITELFDKGYHHVGQTRTLIRGLRNGYDLQSESDYMRMVRDAYPVNFVHFVSRSELSHLSSTGVRELSSFDPIAAERYLV